MEYDRKIIVGRLGAPYGVKGWIKVISFTEPLENILNYLPWQVCLQNKWQTLPIEESKIHGHCIIAKIKNSNDRDEVRKYTNVEIAISRQQLPEVASNDYYWTDLIGLHVITREGIELGIIDSILATGANDVLVIKGERERLIPYVEKFIISVEIEKKRMIVDWDSAF